MQKCDNIYDHQNIDYCYNRKDGLYKNKQSLQNRLQKWFSVEFVTINYDNLIDIIKEVNKDEVNISYLNKMKSDIDNLNTLWDSP